jgi:hypothetical protein
MPFLCSSRFSPIAFNLSITKSSLYVFTSPAVPFSASNHVPIQTRSSPYTLVVVTKRVRRIHGDFIRPGERFILEAGNDVEDAFFVGTIGVGADREDERALNHEILELGLHPTKPTVREYCDMDQPQTTHKSALVNNESTRSHSQHGLGDARAVPDRR